VNRSFRAFTYNFDGRDEYCPGIDPGASKALRRILLVAPLFDEMNRTRRVLASTMRALAEKGIASFLPDLPGTNESSADLVDQDISRWQDAVSAAAEQHGATHIASIRGGALVDLASPYLPHWRLAPVKGAILLKTMLRTRVAGDREAGVTTSADNLVIEAAHKPVLLGGNWLNPLMVSQLNEAVPVEVDTLRTVSLGAEDSAIKGSALWLRAEPQDDPQLAQAMADDLDRWSASCGG
jgi:hypothetical protein